MEEVVTFMTYPLFTNFMIIWPKITSRTIFTRSIRKNSVYFIITNFILTETSFRTIRTKFVKWTS